MDHLLFLFINAKPPPDKQGGRLIQASLLNPESYGMTMKSADPIDLPMKSAVMK